MKNHGYDFAGWIPPGSMEDQAFYADWLRLYQMDLR